MIRTLTLAAAAAALLAGPAAAQTIRISTVGKTPEQVRAEIGKAATRVCLAGPSQTFPIEALAACRKKTVAAALAQLEGGPAIADAAANAKVAQR